MTKQTCYGKIKSWTSSLHFILTEWKCPLLNIKGKKQTAPRDAGKTHTTDNSKAKSFLLYRFFFFFFYKDSVKADIKSRAVKGYLVMPDSQLSLNKEGEADSSSWSTSCLNRLPGWKLSALSAFVDGGVCRTRRKEKTISVTDHCKRSINHLLSRMLLLRDRLLKFQPPPHNNSLVSRWHHPSLVLFWFPTSWHCC